MFSPSPPPLPDRFKLCGVPRKTMLKEMLTSFKPLVSHEKLVWSVCSIIFFHRLVTGWWFQIFFYFHPYLGKVSILTKIFEMGRNHQPGIVTYLRNFGWCFHVPKIQGLLGPHFSLALGAGWSCALVFQSHMWFRKETPAKHALNLKGWWISVLV